MGISIGIGGSQKSGKSSAKISQLIVDELPEIGNSGTIYFLRNPNSDDNENLYDEYLWVNGKWEKFGDDAINRDEYDESEEKFYLKGKN